MINEAALPGGLTQPDEEESIATEGSAETTPGQEQQTPWQVVAVTDGSMKAAIIRGRLEAEGIPARIQQEPAGVVIGLTTGLLGQAKVLVPEPLVDQALGILGQPPQEIEEEND
jgi:hypothetical protein